LEDIILLKLLTLQDTILFDIFKIISSKGYILVTSLLIIIPACIHLRKRSLPFLVTLVIAISISDSMCYRILKPAIERPRPKIQLGLSERKGNLNENDYSMPSNHASNVFAFFVVFLIYVRRYWGLVLVNSLLIAISRIVLVKHYPTDVLAGMLVGALVGYLSCLAVDRIKILKGINPGPASE